MFNVHYFRYIRYLYFRNSTEVHEVFLFFRSRNKQTKKQKKRQNIFFARQVDLNYFALIILLQKNIKTELRLIK